jgi:protein-tyrosine phosphatase
MTIDANLSRRKFITKAAAAGALLIGPLPAFARESLEASADRTGGIIRLSWNTPAQATAILVSPDPAAARTSMRTVKTGVRGGKAEVALPIAPRPYFMLATSGGATTRVAERLLPLQGGTNFRDLGGYRSVDGRQVRWGRIYRSGIMSDLTAADLKYLLGLGITVICDLRSRSERTSEPNPFLAAGGPAVVATDYDIEPATLDRLTRTDSAESQNTMLADGYVDNAVGRLRAQYTDMFARLVRGEAPLAFNCSGGKDRTGMAAALVLSVLGVPRPAVVADYALTGVYLPPEEIMRRLADGRASKLGLTPEAAQAFAKLPPAVQAVRFRTDPDVMNLALGRIDRDYGSPVEFTKRVLGLDDNKVRQLGQLYLI